MEKEEEEEEEKEEESERRSREWKSCHTLFVQEYIQQYPYLAKGGFVV